MEGFLNNDLDIYQIIEDEDIDTLDSYFRKGKIGINTIFLGESLLHLAARKGKLNTCVFLVNKGFNINELSDNYLTPLVEAVSEGYLDIAIILIKSGAWIDGDPRCMTTPLIEASSEGYFNIVKKLVESNADINRLQMNFNRTALDIAIAYGHDDIAAYLESVGARKAFEEMEAGIIEGDGILYHIYNNVGPILTDEYKEDNIKLMTSWIGNGNHHKLFFTFGNFKNFPSTEFLICLPYNWPLNKAILESEYKESFPMKLLSFLSKYYKESPEIKEGFILDKNDNRWSNLNWPDEIDALVTIDYSFDHKEKVNNSLSSNEEVTLFLLVPMKYTKSGALEGGKLDNWIKKRRTASWKSVSFKNEWLSENKEN